MPSGELFALLERLGIETTTHHHPPVFTVEEAKQHRGDLPGAHVKNLFLEDKKDALFLVVAREDTPIDLKSLKEKLGSKHLSFASASLLMELLGVEPGAVTPFGVIHDRERRVKVAIEKRLLDESPLNFHPLDNAATTAIRAEDFLRFLRETGHEPALIEL